MLVFYILYICAQLFTYHAMKVKNTSICILASLFLASCAGSGVKQTSDGVVVTIPQQEQTDVKQIRLQVKGEKLIRVSATPENKFSDRESLIIVPQESHTPFSVARIQVKWFSPIWKEMSSWRRIKVEAKPSLRLKWKVRNNIQFAKCLNRLMMKLFMVWDNISQMNSTTRERMKNFSSITPKFLYHSSYPIRDMAFCGIAIHWLVLVIRMTTSS